LSDEIAVCRLSADPSIDLVAGLCDRSLCDALADAATRRSMRFDGIHRRSDVRWCQRGSDESCDRLVDIVSGWVGLPAAYAEPVQLASYGPDDHYGLHLDTYGSDVEGRRARKRHGERLVTAIVYLRAPAGGGATIFPRLRLRVAPQVGSALVFSLCQAGTDDPDPRGLHRGEAVNAGRKIIANIWFHGCPFDLTPCDPC
jgi:prolyl 4-hydroxylase